MPNSIGDFLQELVAHEWRKRLLHPRTLPADCFYEWQKLDAKTKQPFAIAMKDGKPHAFAGLWERWKDHKAGTDLLTFTVITTDPNELVEQLHDRMPCIISEKDYDPWLKSGDHDRPPIDLLRPFDADRMTAWKVDKAVGNVKNDSPELIEPASTTPMRLTKAPAKLRGLSSRNPDLRGMAVFSQSEKAD